MQQYVDEIPHVESCVSHPTSDCEEGENVQSIENAINLDIRNPYFKRKGRYVPEFGSRSAVIHKIVHEKHATPIVYSKLRMFMCVRGRALLYHTYRQRGTDR